MPPSASTEAARLSALALPRDIDTVVETLRDARMEWRAAHERNREEGGRFPSRQSLKRIMRELGVALFPLRLGPPELTADNENAFIAASLESTLAQLAAQIGIEFAYHDPHADHATVARRAQDAVDIFAAGLAGIRRTLDGDVEAAYANDPAAHSVDEVLAAYPSLTAIIHYRIARVLHGLGAHVVARIIASIAQGETGIDIHPAATIGRSFFIDHGTGVVIGETAVLGDRVRLYQGVTLGGDPRLADHKGGHLRHPVVEDDVVIHANASIVGRVTIGARSRIEGNLWLARDVPPDSFVEAPPPVILSPAADRPGN